MQTTKKNEICGCCKSGRLEIKNYPDIVPSCILTENLTRVRIVANTLIQKGSKKHTFSWFFLPSCKNVKKNHQIVILQYFYVLVWCYQKKTTFIIKFLTEMAFASILDSFLRYMLPRETVFRRILRKVEWEDSHRSACQLPQTPLTSAPEKNSQCSIHICHKHRPWVRHWNAFGLANF